MSTRAKSTTIEPYDVGLHYATTPAHWAGLARRFDLDTTDAPSALAQTSLATHTVSHEAHVLIWVDLPAHRDAATHLLGTIAHEATHAALTVLEHVGQPLKPDEASAYLVDWLVRWLTSQTPGLTLALTAARTDQPEDSR